ncbi:MAG: cob(I)yrinic acid a,c-diamide adenosyltransferase [Oscillospiraceae bacterium]
MKNGYVQVYTGDGKGKTTAALGLILRAAGAGFKIYLGQFMKNSETSEILALKKLGADITIEEYGTGDELTQSNINADKHAAQKGYEKACAAITSGKYDLVVLDEINVAESLGYLSEAEVLGLINAKPSHTELVLTGRNASQSVIDAADLVTQMQEIKHYYTKGVKARKGIEK